MDFNYAGVFYDQVDGLYLTQYRVYDPVVGRWISRDPIGEGGNIAGNLYPYVDDLITGIDPSGLYLEANSLSSLGAGLKSAVQQTLQHLDPQKFQSCPVDSSPLMNENSQGQNGPSSPSITADDLKGKTQTEIE